MGVGCVLDLLAGALHPQGRAGLEWTFRLSREPHRLWRRYLVNDVPMFARLMCAGPKDEPSEALAGTS